MPKPVYTLCTHAIAVNPESGLFSAIEFVERLNLTPAPPPVEGSVVVVTYRQLRVTSCWMIDLENGETHDDEFECQMVVVSPDGETTDIVTRAFRFTGDDGKKHFHRFVISFDSPFPVKGNGVARIVSKARKIGSSEWITQEYPIVVQTVQPKADEPPKNTLPTD